MTQSAKTALSRRLTQQKLLFDGAFGTYYAQLFDTRELPELANTLHPERVLQIHRDYIEAGAQLIRTNTFAANTFSLDLPWEAIRENLRQGYRLAKEAARGKDVQVAADIGQIPYDSRSNRGAVASEYLELCRTFLEEGADCFVFETLADLEDLRDAIALVGDQAFVVVQFSVNQFGYSHAGLSARKLIQRAEEIPQIDAVGFNCGVGPGHMQKIIREVPFHGKKFRTALPNAGYPQYISNRMIFHDRNIDYFADKVRDMARDGADLLGGCCGTTPAHIRALRDSLSLTQPKRPPVISIPTPRAAPKEDYAFFAGKEGKKLIAVELAPPVGSDDKTLMDAAHLLQKSGVDVLTFPDSPSGRTRADSILMAEKVARETGMQVMPHICCRDKNAIAMRSQLLGAYLNHIDNFLVITGDPIPSLVRNSVKSVFNFDSVGLMGILNDMNEDQFAAAPITYGGAVNQSRKNLDFEISRVKKKMAAGASFFLSQPASTKESIHRLRRVKAETGARILCGIMPFVSLKNALFIKNEMTGIQVTDEVLARYRPDMTREEGEAAGIRLAQEMMALSADFADGYYFSFPFNRVSMLEKILRD